MNNDKLYVVIPAYNEEENIESVVRSWYSVLSFASEGSKLVVADSGSADNTHSILLSLQSELPGIEILSDTLKQHGPKLIAMYAYAIKNGADFIFQTDSDGQTNPAEFEAFWRERNAFDAIIGMRTVRGDGKARKYVEEVLCALLKVYFGVSVPDSNAPFRLMRSELVAKYLPKLRPDYNLPNVMLTTYFAYYAEKVLFKEISFKPRQAGENSINIKKIVKIGCQSLYDFYNLRKNM